TSARSATTASSADLRSNDSSLCTGCNCEGNDQRLYSDTERGLVERARQRRTLQRILPSGPTPSAAFVRDYVPQNRSNVRCARDSRVSAAVSLRADLDAAPLAVAARVRNLDRRTQRAARRRR